ncbi:hypothetical protein D3C72_1387980 [compost metagenome]
MTLPARSPTTSAPLSTTGGALTRSPPPIAAAVVRLTAGVGSVNVAESKIALVMA